MPVQSSEHPVESGVELTSHVKPKPAVLRVHGEIVGDGWQDTALHFRALARGGFLVQYIGRNVLTNARITAFSTRATHKIYGGVSFEMTLQEVRVARKHWVAADYGEPLIVGMMNYDGTVRVEHLSEPRERYHVAMAGETLWFIAEQYRSLGVSTEALRALNRGRGVFRPGHEGDFAFLLPGARLLLGVW